MMRLIAIPALATASWGVVIVASIVIAGAFL